MFRFKRKFELARRCRRVGARATPFVTMLAEESGEHDSVAKTNQGGRE